MRVLVVEDDRKTAGFISKALKAEGFAVDVLHNGDEALSALCGTPFDAAVLDIMLAGRDGLSVLRQLRAKGNRTPVLLLSARGEVNERVEGLNAGADDYVAKPFALEELLARVRTLVRRGGETKSPILRLGNLTLDTTTRTAQRGDRKIELTTREYRLLEFLMRAPGRVQRHSDQPCDVGVAPVRGCRVAKGGCGAWLFPECRSKQTDLSRAMIPDLIIGRAITGR